MIKETIFGRSDNWVYKTGGCHTLCVCVHVHMHIYVYVFVPVLVSEACMCMDVYTYICVHMYGGQKLTLGIFLGNFILHLIF